MPSPLTLIYDRDNPNLIFGVDYIRMVISKQDRDLTFDQSLECE